jgi:UDP-N-acetylglucosamine diphosphorylase/glucosamine-1-phosphate N-acetyltransferase
MKITKAVILAAGEGSRLRPLTSSRPKVMLPICNKPILEHLLLNLQKAGINDFYFIVGYHDEQIREYFGDGAKFGVTIQYFNQRVQLGTADALRLVSGIVDGTFLVANGDVILFSDDIRRVTGNTGNTLSVIELTDVSEMGVIEVDEGHVARVYEKVLNPPSHLANAGLYLFTQDIFEAIEKTDRSVRGEYEITDSIQIMIDSGKTVSFQVISRWPELDYPWDLITANEKMMPLMEPRCLGEIEESTTIKGSVSVGKGTIIRSGSYIIGPVIIGQNCDIGPNCFIKGSTAIGDNCHIGAAVEINNSIIMSGSKIPHLNYVADSVIGTNCNLGAGTKIANTNSDNKFIKINDIDTKRRNLGAIIGDNVQTGINASISVGTVIGSDAFIGPGSQAHDIISPGSKIL